MNIEFSSFLSHLSSRLMASMAEDLEVRGEKAAYSSKVCVVCKLKREKNIANFFFGEVL